MGLLATLVLAPAAARAWTDTDGDRLADAREAEVGTSPTDPDTDDDGALDGAEIGTADFGSHEGIFDPGPGTIYDDLFAADLDGDGDADLVMAAGDAVTLRWLENRLDEASADFAPPQLVGSAGLVRSVFAIDLDGDLDLDVLSASSSSGDGLAWFENRLDEASNDFAEHAVTPTTETDGARAVFATDLDGDGDPDVLSASQNDDKVAWYENRLDEVSADFGPQQVISTLADSPVFVHAADVDEDGDADVVSASINDDVVAWYENRLDEVSADFGPQQVITTQTSSPLEVYIRDLDNDGDGDVVSGEGIGAAVAWYENRLDEPSADFGPKQVIASGGQAVSLAVTDTDGDGDPDIVASATSELQWLENRLDEPSADFGFLAVPSGVGVVSAVEAADLDGDFGIDLVRGIITDGDVAWHAQATTDPLDADSDDDLLLDGFEIDAGFDPVTPGETFENPDGDGLHNLEEQGVGTDPTLADSDGDGLKDGPEIEIGTDPLDPDSDDDGLADGDEVLVWSFAGPFTVTTAVDAPWDVFGADLDGDGDTDLLSASANDDRVAWYENRLDEASADFGPQQVLSTLDVARGVSAFDVDGDGDLDVFAGSDTTSIWHENRLDEPSADFAPALAITSPALACWSFAFEDFDGDMDPDLVCGGNGQVVRLDNRLDEASGDFGPQVVLGTEGSFVRNVTLVDLDQDLDRDILAGGYQGSTGWYENRLDEASADFGPRQALGDGPEDYAALPADLDDDGDEDVVWVRGGGFGAALRSQENLAEVGMGFGATSTLVDFSSSVFGADLDVRDLDLDGDPDLLVGALSGPTTAWYENGASWTAQSLPVPAFDGAGRILTTDLTGDGAAEIVLGWTSADSIVWLERRNANPHDPDTDGDGLLDGFEWDFGFDVLTPGQENEDPDGDGLTNLGEQSAGTDPHDADSDDDGFSDGKEVAAGTDPLDPLDFPPPAVPALGGPATLLLILGLLIAGARAGPRKGSSAPAGTSA